jgi:tripartite-type tricarboxylate transporter receptor subunit TctC
MKLPDRRQFLQGAASVTTLPFAPHIARAQTYPTRPITIVVPAAAGGPTDTITRILADHMRGSLGQTVIIENNGAAAGSIAVGRAARAAPDGYTLSIGHVGTHVFNGAIYTLSYDVLTDFEPISLLVSNPQMVISKTALPAKNLKELISWLKANQDHVTAGTAGAGSPAHITGIYFQKLTDTHFQFVPYRGGGPAQQDVVAGQIDLMFDQAVNSIPRVRAGQIKAYAVTSNTRLVAAPDIPTTDEAGLPGFYTSIWHALWAPKGTPKEIIAKIDAAIVDALADEAVRRRLADLGQEIFPRDRQTPSALGVYQKAEIDKWWPIIKAANIKAE